MASREGEPTFRADRLRSARLARGIKTQAELAAMIGVRESMISTWERGLHEPRLSIVTRLARALRCSTDYLLGVSEELDGSGRARS